MGPMFLDLLLPVVGVLFPEPAGKVDGSEVDDEAVLDVVLAPEGVARVVGGIDDTLNNTGLRKEGLNDKGYSHYNCWISGY